MKAALGVDLGGTWLRACLLDPRARSARRVKRPAVAPMHSAPALARLMKSLAFPRLERLTIGSTGIWSPRQKKSLKRSLAGLAAKVEVFSDVELAHRGALAGDAGVLVIAGTGSIALARDPRGRRRRAGGLGPMLGDEGSAFWIGKTALGEPKLKAFLPDPLSLARAPRPQKATAALARRVLALAARHPAAAALRRRAAGHIAALAAEASRGLSFRGKIPLSWHGGLFEDRAFLEDFLRAARRADRRFDPRPPLLAPEVAAAILL